MSASTHSARPSLAYVVNTLNPGGTEKLVVEMSLAFASEFNLRVVCLDEPGRWAADLRARGIPVHCVWRQPGLDLAMPLKLARLFRQWGVDIVHAHQCTPWFYSALSRLIYSKPRVLLEEHGRFFPEVENRKRAWVNRHIVRGLTRRFIAVSRDIRERLARYEGLDERQIEVVYNGVAPEPPLTAAERAALRQQLGFGPDDFVVGTVGRFDPIKNLPMLVGALERAAATRPQIAGLLVGHGPEFAAIQSLVMRGPMASRIHLTGFRSDARELAQCMDLFVLASFSEGTSMALLEALAAGVPVAVTRVGGNPEIVQNGVSGWVVPSNDVAALAEAISQAASDEPVRRAFAEEGRRRFEKHFDLTTMIANYRRIYGELGDPGRLEEQRA